MNEQAHKVIFAAAMMEKKNGVIVKIVFGASACPFRREAGRKGRAARFNSRIIMREISARIPARLTHSGGPHAGFSHRHLFLVTLLAFLLFVKLQPAHAQGAISPAVADSLIRELAVVEEADQQYRQQLEAVQQQFGGDSEAMKQLLRAMKQADSLNLVKVSAILERYGWPGANVIGSSANTTLFMVIQHSDLAQQDYYLPLMRKAVKEGNASASQLALLEDRVALLHHRKQRYGSQVRWDMKSNEYSLLPLEDPQHVDERRKEAGLQPLKDYLKSCCNLDWNVEAYLKEQEISGKDTD